MGTMYLSTVVALVSAGWNVEETPLVPPPWVVEAAHSINPEWVGVLAVLPPTDGGYRPTASAVFATRVDGGPELLARFPASAVLNSANETGTGFDVTVSTDAGIRVHRIRTEPTPTLVDLGEFTEHVLASSCDANVSQCVVVLASGETIRWREGGERSQLSPAFESGPSGAAMRDDAAFAALLVSDSAVLVELATGKLTAFLGRARWNPKRIEAVGEGPPPGAQRQKWKAVRERCLTAPLGWNEGRLVIGHSAYGDIGADPCPVESFEFDPRTGAQTPVPEYPWKVLDCPVGGWTSAIGTFVTACADFPTPRAKVRDGPEEEDPPMPLPEAVALSPTDIFVMARPRPSKWSWFRGAPKGKGLPFVLEGPSVITFQSRGVVVEGVTWKYGSAVFEESLADDWHLISPHDGRPVVVRLRNR